MVYAIYQFGSFSRAADELFIGQSSLSMAIQRIENELGMPLFDRKHHPIRLTAAGKAYIEYYHKVKPAEKNMLAYASVFCTGNMRSCAELYYQGIFKKNPVALKRAVKYSCILLSFLTGAVIATVVGEAVGEKCIWLGACMAILCGILVSRESWHR